jgi:hypothetical protein
MGWVPLITTSQRGLRFGAWLEVSKKLTLQARWRGLPAARMNGRSTS